MIPERINGGKANIDGLIWHHHQDMGRMQLIGDKSKVAVELNGMPSSRNGFIMLYVNGQSFGQTEFRYDVAASLRLFEALMTGADYYAPDLLTLDAEEFRELVDGLHDDHPDPRFEKLWHHFEKIDERLIVRLDYAFDQCLIGIAASDVEERIFAIDPDGNRSEARTLPLGTIRSLVSQARTEWDSLNGSRLA